MDIVITILSQDLKFWLYEHILKPDGIRTLMVDESKDFLFV